MEPITFTVDGPPQVWKRAGRRTIGGRVTTFTEAGHNRMRQRVAWGALEVRPKWWPLSRRYALAVRVYMPSREHEGDFDNYEKLVADALQGILWADDRQIDFGICAKAVDAEDPRTEVEALIVERDASELAALATLAGLAQCLCPGSGVHRTGASCPQCLGTGIAS